MKIVKCGAVLLAALLLCGAMLAGCGIISATDEREATMDDEVSKDKTKETTKNKTKETIAETIAETIEDTAEETMEEETEEESEQNPAFKGSVGLIFTSNGDGTCYVAGIGQCTDTDVVIPAVSPAGDTVTSIGQTAFYMCVNLKSITIPDSVTSIQDGAFYKCKELKSIIIPEGVTSIGFRAFEGCTDLESVTIPASVVKIGQFAFDGCSSISITVDEGNPVYCSGGNCILEKNSDEEPGTEPDTEPPHEHSFGEWSEDKAATCTEKGSEKRTCVCGESEHKDVEPLGHSEGIWIIDVYPGIGVGGTKHTQCKICGDILYETISPLKPSAGLEFASYDNGTCCVYSIGNCYATNIVIPSVSPNGEKVVAITFGAFKDCDVESITIPDTVTKIEAEAFEYCRATRIILPDTVIRIGKNAFRNCRNLESIIIPKGVTTIEEYTFSGCESLKSVTIPDSVTSIGTGAFSNCRNLENIKIPDSVGHINNYAFGACTKATQLEDGISYIDNWVVDCSSDAINVNLRESTIGIADGAFAESNSLVSVRIPDSVTQIGDRAFYKCENLFSINIPKGITRITKSVFDGCDNLAKEEGIAYAGNWAVNCDEDVVCAILRADTIGIADNTFDNCTNLKNILIPDGVKNIGEYAFQNCMSLTDLNIPKSVDNLGEYTFASGCSSLKEIIILDGTTTIGDAAFANCSSIENIIIPDSVIWIGSRAFAGCSSLTEITIPQNVINLGTRAFDGCTSLKTVFFNAIAMNDLPAPDESWGVFNNAGTNTNGMKVIVGENVTVIPAYLFATRYYFATRPNLVSVEFVDSSSCERIGVSAFEYCDNLVAFTIPDSVLYIGRSAFAGCSSLTEITIPQNVKDIQSGAFSQCGNLEIVYFNACDMNDLEGIFGASGKSGSGIKVIVGSNVTHLPDYLFSHKYAGSSSLNLTIVEFSDESMCTEIGDWAFYDCDNLTSIELPNGITYIGEGALKKCKKLTNIIFKGTMSEWKSIIKGNNWNTGTGSYTVHCTDGDLSKSES